MTAANGGQDNDPAWVLNLRANPDAKGQLKGDDFTATATELSGDDKEAALAKLRSAFRALARFEARTEREIPCFRLVRS